MANKTLAKDTVREEFISRFKTDSQADVLVSSNMKDEALGALTKMEIPTRKWEAWKYTNLKPITSQDFQYAQHVSPDHIANYQIPNLIADRLVFVNGEFNPALSSIKNNEGVLTVQALSQLDKVGKEVFEAHAGKYVSTNSDIFTALNAAYSKDGVLIYITKGKVAKAPIHLIHLTGSNHATLTQHRNLFVVSENAEAKVVETFHSLTDETSSFRNAVNEISVGANAGLEYVRLQLEADGASQVDTTLIHQADDSRCSIFTLTLSGGLVRNNLDMKLDGENISSELMGIYLLSGMQHVDNHTQVDHMKPNCYSNELYKGIINEKATGIFNGRIHVYQDAQKTNAFQANRNILLSDTANIYTKPQLEIYADDVKCSHGATTGRFDEDAMFYLRARGINEYNARLMLIFAFVMEVVNHISIEAVRDHIQQLVEKRF